MKFIKYLITYILLSIMSFSAASQIAYKNNGVSIGSKNVSSNQISITDMHGLSLIYGANALYFDVQPGSRTYIYSSTDTILFRDKERGFYNFIRCENIRTLSDARAKIDIRPLDAGLSAAKDIGQRTSGKAKSSIPFEEELARRFPNLVTRDSEGCLLVNYIELIPVLVNAVNELSEKAARQSDELKNLSNAIE